MEVEEDLTAHADFNAINQSKSNSPGMSEKDESGFGEDISACSIEDKTFTEKMDIHETDNHFTLKQSGNNKKLDDSLMDQSFSLGGMKKDDSGIYSERSANSTNPKETSDGEWSESVSESLEETNGEVKEQEHRSAEAKVSKNNKTENTASVPTKIKNNEAIKSFDGNNVKSDGIEGMEAEFAENKNNINGDATDNKDDISDSKELKDCDKQDSNEKAELERQQNFSDKSDKVDETNDDEDFAEFIRKTVKARSHVRKLVDYDSDDSEQDSDSSPVVAKGHRRYRKRKPETDSEEETNANDNSKTVSEEQNDGTPVLLKHSQLNTSSEQNNAEISEGSSDSSDDSLHSPKTRHDSSSDNEPDEVPPDVSEFGPPKHKWRALFDLRKREFGYSNSADSGQFRKKVQGSLQMVKRFELQFKMEKHEGCVNALHFNRIGTKKSSFRIF